MPVLINQDSGLAEDLPDESADSALSSGTHQLPLNDPQGNPVVASLDQSRDLLSQGYSQPSPDQLGSLLKQAKFSSTPEQVKSALEGAASSFSFGLSTAAERAMGVNPEDIMARRETNPGVYGLGQGAGLVGSMLVGTGEAALLAKAAKGVAGVAGLGRVGSAIVKGAVETALFQAGDEVSKKFANDPNQSTESVLTDIGLSGVLGGALGGGLGVISPLWSAANETRLGKVLGAIKDKANGEEKNLAASTIDQLAEKSGINISPEVKAGLGNNPEANQMFQELNESNSTSGKKSLASLEDFKKSANDAILTGLGKTPEQIESLSEMSDYDLGDKLKNSLITELKETSDPLSKQFNDIKAKFAGEDLSNARKAVIAQDINQFAQKEGYYLLPGTPQEGLISKTITGLSKVNTLDDLRILQSQIGEQTKLPDMWKVGRGIKNALRSAEENLVEEKLGAEAPELIEQHKAARASYKSTMDTLDDLNDRLHVGRYAGPDSFVTALKDMAPEDVLRRLTPKNDAGLLQFMGEKFPATTASIKDHYLNQLLKSAGQKAVGDNTINVKNLFTNLDKWSPELKQFALPEGALEKISSIKGLLDAVPSRMNPSGTAKTLDKLWAHLPAGAMGIVSMLMGHSPIAGAVLGELGTMVTKEVPDAVKLATLKFLGNGNPINAGAFKSAVDMTASILSGEAKITKAAGAVFKASQDVVPSHLVPDVKDRLKLDKKLKDLHADTSSLLEVGGQAGYYLPDHGSALASTAGRAAQYLNSIRPKASKFGPLDPELSPSNIETAAYNRALDIAEQPLLVLKSIKDGTLTMQDVKTINSIYPNLVKNITQQLTNEMISHVSKGNMVPYPTRLSLSLFMGQALDSSMSPQAIMANQIASMQPQQQPIPAGSKQKSSMTHLGKLAVMSQTQGQAREAEKATRT